MPADDRPIPADADPTPARTRLRERWELASVLNFLHVFEPVIEDKLGVSAEQIEDGLIEPDGVLAKVHIALLKGIPPASKNLGVSDAWVTVLCKKIKQWWPWVAEGDLPLKADHGSEITKYKEFDPTTRLLILKALCEIRGEQHDIVQYVDQSLKSGSPFSTFCKHRLGQGINGATYWFDGDQVIGYRLYQETIVNSKQRMKGKGHDPAFDFLWETLATDFDEFQKISARLSASQSPEEVEVGNVINMDIMPVLDKLQKKKERVAKRRHRETKLLTGYLGAGVSRRSCRDRGTVCYTFDEFDRSISEAIQISKKRLIEGVSEVSTKIANLDEGDGSLSGNSSPTASHGIDRDGKNSDGDDDEDYNEKSEADDENGNYRLGDSDKEFDELAEDGKGKPVLKLKKDRGFAVGPVRRSTRNLCPAYDGKPSLELEDMGPAEMKKRLRQRPTCNSDYSQLVVLDSEDENACERDKSAW